MSRDINILILNVSDKVELVREFQRAKLELRLSGKIITSDLKNDVLASREGDKHINLKPILDEGYIDDIVRVCNEENISLIIPTTDLELNVLSENKHKIEKNTSSKVMISDNDVINICRNKFNTFNFLVENGFKTPIIITDEDIKYNNFKFPLYIKPFDGRGSINNFKLNSKKELVFFKEYIKKPLIQEFIEGDEYCVDMLNDFEGRPIIIVPRLKLKICSGNVIEGKIIKDRLIIDTIKNLCKKIKLVGAINIDCIVKNDEVFVLEINARFAEGVPITYNSGANYQVYLYKLLIGEDVKYNEEYNDNIVVSRYNEFSIMG